jgi:uncharacterized protein YbjT (DUF2867 family)
MRLTIVAATGGIGRLALEQAVAAGHDVTAVVRNPANLTRPVRAVRVDLAQPDPAALASAVDGADAVLSGLGPRSRAETGIAARGTQAVIEAMKQAGSRRLIVVSAAPLGTVASPANPHPPRHDPGDGFFMRHIFSHLAKALFASHYADLAVMEDELRASGLEWTIVRPPRLSNQPLTGRYRTANGRNVRGGWIVPRADVADLMLRLAGQPESIAQVVGVAT